MKLEARLIEVVRYPTGTKLTGIICVHKIFQLIGTLNWGWWLLGNQDKLKNLCKDATLKNLVIMTHDWKEVSPADEDEMKRNFPTQYSHAIREGVQVYHCTNASELDLGALRVILGGGPVVPKVQREPINKGSKSEQTAVATELSKEIPDLAERHNSDVKKLEEGTQEAMDKKGEEHLRELEEQNRRAQEEADGLRKYIAEMQSKEESRRKEVDVFKKQIAEMQSEEITRKEMERRAREEADGLRKRIAEMQSKLEEDRHTSGKASATYLNFPHVSAHPI